MKFNEIYTSPFFVAFLILAFYGLVIFVLIYFISKNNKNTSSYIKQYGIISGAVKGYNKERSDIDIPGGVDYGTIGSFERSKRDKTIMELTGGFGGFG
jgi:hypothetical protein